MLGRIVGDTLEQARCELTPLGVAISECIRYIEIHGSNHGHNLQVIAKVVMPDYVHFILYVKERLSDCKLGDIIRGFKQGCNKALRSAIKAQEGEVSSPCAVPEQQGPQELGADGNDKQDNAKPSAPIPDEPNVPSPDVPNAPSPSVPFPNAPFPASSNPASSSSSSLTEGVLRPASPPVQPPTQPPPSPPASAPQHGYRQPPLPIISPRMLRDHALFEADFDETILRRRGQLKTMIRYVHNNPKHRWQKQRHPDLLIPMRGIMIAGKMYDAIGNITLLGMERHQVWIRSRWDEMLLNKPQKTPTYAGRSTPKGDALTYVGVIYVSETSD